MYKKILILLAILSTTLFNSSSAQVFKAKSIEGISTKEPESVISVKAMRELSLKDGVVIEKNSIITGTMSDIIKPAAWHKNAGFTFTPISYIDSNGKKHFLSGNNYGTYRQKMKPDYKHSEITIGSEEGSGFLFSPSYIYNTKRIIKGEGKEVLIEYKNRNTPWGVGEEIKIKPNEVVYFNFPDLN